MMRLQDLGALSILGCTVASSAAQSQPTEQNVIALAAGTKVELAVTAPVWAKTAKPHDPLYLQTIFPVVTGASVAIPAGAYVQGTILALTPPTRRSSHAEIQVLFNKIIFANGYAVALPDASAQGAPAGSTSPATAARLTIQVSTANDLLLDNGTQLEMTLAAPVALDAALVAAALPVTRAVVPGSFRSATRCRPTQSTPGSPDTVIPGSPGTPSTTIPGGPGMPDITIPGTPATPATVIPGMSGTMGTSCPAQPMVTASEPLTLPPPPAQSAQAH